MPCPCPYSRQSPFGCQVQDFSPRADTVIAGQGRLIPEQKNITLNRDNPIPLFANIYPFKQPSHVTCSLSGFVLS